LLFAAILISENYFPVVQTQRTRKKNKYNPGVGVATFRGVLGHLML